MIAFVRTASIAPGKTGSAMAFAHDVAAYIKKAHDVQLEVLRPIGGNPSRVAWSSRYKDLAAMEAFNTKLFADKAYWELVGKSSDCFIAGSINDVIWTTA